MNSSKEKKAELETILSEVLPLHNLSGAELDFTIQEISQAAELKHITEEYRSNQFLEKSSRRKLNALLEALGAALFATSATLVALWAAIQALV